MGMWVWRMNWKESGRRQTWWTIKCGTTNASLGARFYTWPSLTHNRSANHLTRGSVSRFLWEWGWTVTGHKFWTCDDGPDTQTVFIQANRHMSKKFLKNYTITDMGWQTVMFETRGLWSCEIWETMNDGDNRQLHSLDLLVCYGS